MRAITIFTLKILSFLLIPLFVYFFIVNSSLLSITPTVDIYTPSDEETNFLTALSVSHGEPLYNNFSISYPPGRFLAQALFFRLTAPSVVAARIYMNLFTPLLFPTLLFLLTYRLLRRRKLAFVPAYFLAWLALLLDLTIVHSAQEIHVVLTAFMLVLLSDWPYRLRTLALGLLLGLVFLFRFEAGIILVLSLLLAYRRLPPFISVTGFLLLWLPLMIHLIFAGTLGNFLSDTVILGLLTQPRVMGQAIPNNALWYVFLSTFILLYSLSLSLWQKGDRRLQVVAAVALFSYVSALGRSDEGHLWYGLVWLPLLASYAMTELKHLNLFSLLSTALLLFAVGYLVIIMKSPAFFMLVVSFSLIFAKYSRTNSSTLTLAGAVVALTIFHSFRYFTLRLQIPRFAGALAAPWKFTPTDHSIGGLDFPVSTLTNLAAIRSHLTDPNPSLFIFPENTILYEYFHLPRPTRYFYLTGERTATTESQIIRDLENSDNLYVLVFSEKARERGGEVWNWINTHTTPVISLPYQSTSMELRH